MKVELEDLYFCVQYNAYVFGLICTWEQWNIVTATEQKNQASLFFGCDLFMGHLWKKNSVKLACLNFFPNSANHCSHNSLIYLVEIGFHITWHFSHFNLSITFFSFCFVVCYLVWSKLNINFEGLTKWWTFLLFL